MESYERTLYCYDWFEKIDTIQGTTTINGWCIDREGTPHLVILQGFGPCVYVELPLYIDKIRHNWNKEDANLVVDIINSRMDDDRCIDYEAKTYKTLYRGAKEFPMLKMKFTKRSDIIKLDNMLKRNIFVRELGDLTLKVWETKISTIRQFLTKRVLKHAQWFTFKCKKVDDIDKISSLEHEYIADYECIFPISQKDTRSWISMPSVLTLDIETYSDNPKAMPIRTMDAHVAYMISCIYQRINDISTRKRYIIIMGDCSDLDKIIAQKEREEKESILGKIASGEWDKVINSKYNDKIIKEKISKGETVTIEDLVSNFDQKIEIIRVKDEFALCEALTNIIYKHNPEILSGYNILGFDYPYLNARLARLVKDWNSKASRILGKSPELVIPKKWESKAYGFTENYFIDFPGRISIDMLPIIRRGHKLPKYDLDTVGNAFLKRGKHDIKAPQMFKYYEDLVQAKKYYEKCVKEWTELKKSKKENEEAINNFIKDHGLPESHFNTFIEGDKYYLPVYRENVDKNVIIEVVKRYEDAKINMAKVALYCVEDSELVVDLIDKTGIWIGLMELSNTVGVSIVETYSRGQQIRGMSLVYNLLEPLGVVIDYMPPDSNSKYVGGFVADPIPGIDDKVITLDFASLYPSIIMAYNICMNTFLKPGEEVGLIQGVDYEGIKCPFFDDDDNEIGFNIHRFLKASKREGYIPRLVRDIVNERKAVKKQMFEVEEGSLEWIVLNERQLALKVCANSIYGMLGVREGGLLPFMQGAESVTSIGREKIQFCNKYLIDKYGANIVYNDTDSTMFTLPFVKTYEEAIEWGKKLEKELTSTMPPPMALEFEKVGRMLRFKKKKYAYWPADKDAKAKNKITGKWEPNPNFTKLKPYDEIITRGIVLARRDNCKLLREIYRRSMEMIMDGVEMMKTLSYMMKECILLLRGEVDISSLILIKALGANYKQDNFYMNLFARFLKDIGKPASPGDRLEMFVCEGEGLLGQRLRLPETYFERLDSDKPEKIDYRYYLENLFSKSLEQLWSVGYRKKLDELERQYDLENKMSIVKWIYQNTLKRDKGAGITQVWNHFNGDLDKICLWLEDVNNHKYLHNKYIKGRQSMVSGRSVFNARITKTPIKLLLKAVDMGKLEEYAKVILNQKDYEELFPVINNPPPV